MENKYKQRSASQRIAYLKRVRGEVEERGFTFIGVEFIGTNNYIYYEEVGKIRRQHVASFRRGNKIKELSRKWPKGSGIYRLWIEDEIVYLGKTKDFATRLCNHLGQKKSAVSGYQDQITKIEVAPLGEADTNIQELYLLAKYKPRLNVKDVPKDYPSFKIEEPLFVEVTGWK